MFSYLCTFIVKLQHFKGKNMKKLSVLALGLLFSMAAMSQAVITFEKTSHDFGKIEKGGEATYDFKFTNTGDSALIITGVRTTCGCTSPTWTRTPVEPGQTGIINVKYLTTSRPGRFNKNVTVNSNSKTPENPDGSVPLNINGEVIDTEVTAAQ